MDTAEATLSFEEHGTINSPLRRSARNARTATHEENSTRRSARKTKARGVLSDNTNGSMNEGRRTRSTDKRRKVNAEPPPSTSSSTSSLVVIQKIVEIDEEPLRQYPIASDNNIERPSAMEAVPSPRRDGPSEDGGVETESTNDTSIDETTETGKGKIVVSFDGKSTGVSSTDPREAETKKASEDQIANRFVPETANDPATDDSMEYATPRKRIDFSECEPRKLSETDKQEEEIGKNSEVEIVDEVMAESTNGVSTGDAVELTTPRKGVDFLERQSPECLADDRQEDESKGSSEGEISTAIRSQEIDSKLRHSASPMAPAMSLPENGFVGKPLETMSVGGEDAASESPDLSATDQQERVTNNAAEEVVVKPQEGVSKDTRRASSVTLTTTVQEKVRSKPALEAMSLAEQDQVVYGSLNKMLADAFAEKLDAAISEGVDSLPLLDDDCYRDEKSSNNDGETSKIPPKKQLINALRYKFFRNVDVLESYCSYHLLTLRKHPPARRKRIVAVTKGGFEALPTLDSTAVDDYEVANKKDVKGQNPSSEQYYPTPSEIPSEQEQKDLVEELSRLQLDLVAAKKKRNALRASLESLKHAEQAAGDALATVEAHAPSLDEGAIRSDVTEKAEQAHTAGQLMEEANALSKILDDVKHDRAENHRKKSEDEEENGYDFVQRDDPFYKASYRAGHKRQKKLTMEEAYQEDRRRFGFLRDATNDNPSQNDNRSSGITVQAFKSMLLTRLSAPSPAGTPKNETPAVEQMTE